MGYVNIRHPLWVSIGFIFFILSLAGQTEATPLTGAIAASGTSGAGFAVLSNGQASGWSMDSSGNLTTSPALITDSAGNILSGFTDVEGYLLLQGNCGNVWQISSVNNGWVANQVAGISNVKKISAFQGGFYFATCDDRGFFYDGAVLTYVTNGLPSIVKILQSISGAFSNYSSGPKYQLLLTGGGEVYVHGDSYNMGQLGSGNSSTGWSQVIFPTSIGSTGFSRAIASTDVSAFLKNGTIYFVVNTTPSILRTIPNLSNVTSIVFSYYPYLPYSTNGISYVGTTILATKSDGTVWAFVVGGGGQPYQVSGLAGIVALGQNMEAAYGGVTYFIGSGGTLSEQGQSTGLVQVGTVPPPSPSPSSALVTQQVPAVPDTGMILAAIIFMVTGSTAIFRHKAVRL